ncbi:MAG: glutaredoxin family protein [Burkholderiales bacterium]
MRANAELITPGDVESNLDSRDKLEPAKLSLTLYSRQYCHLCHEMLAQVKILLRSLEFQSLASQSFTSKYFEFEIQVIDVDTDPVLEDRYGELVPVLIHEGKELARYRLDVQSFERYLNALGNEGRQ